MPPSKMKHNFSASKRREGEETLRLKKFICSICGTQVELLTPREELRCPNTKCNSTYLKEVKEYPTAFDIVGYCYMNSKWGKHNWKRGKTDSEIADVYNDVPGAKPY